MKTALFYFEVLAFVLLAIIPWPGPTVFKISCPRESAAIVRKVIQKKWTPVLDRFHVTLPLECPFHPQRDMFGPQQAAKRQHRPSLWTCGFCGKSFYEEKFLDIHFDNRHKGKVNMAEDAVCLADYCDIMRCEVLATQTQSALFLNDNGHKSTDVEIWREATVYRTALVLAGPRDLVRVGPQVRVQRPTSTSTPLCAKVVKQTKPAKDRAAGGGGGGAGGSSKEGGEGDGDGNATSEQCDDPDLVDAALPSGKQRRISELHKLKANCKPEQLNVLREHCVTIVQDCIAGLLVNLSDQEFREVEEELSRSVCWYLTCDRYWEDTIGDTRPFPWGLVFVLVMVLSLGLCFVYYVIWVLFDSEDGRHGDVFGQQQGSGQTTDGSSTSDQYIYVSYPPDLKRRLLESAGYAEYQRSSVLVKLD